MPFAWDEDKAANERKHGVTFPEAQTVFDDMNAPTPPAQMTDDDLRPEYDDALLREMLAKGERSKFAACTTPTPDMVKLEPDVAAVFDTPEAVNAALRFLIKVTKDNAPAVLPGA